MKHLVVGATVAAALALAGCGSDNGSAAGGPTTTAALTHEQFVSQANAICKAGTAKLDAAATGFADPNNPTQAEIVDATKKVMVPTLTDELTQLRALTPPAADAATVTTMLGALESGISKAAADPMAALQGDAFAQANTSAKQLGLTDCGS